MGSYKTLPELFWCVFNSNRQTILFHDRHQGQWKPWRNQEFGQELCQLTLALRALGVKRGDRVGLMCEPSARWIMFDLALMFLGAVSVPMFSNVSASHLSYQVKHADIQYLCLDRLEAYQALATCGVSLKTLIDLGRSLDFSEKSLEDHSSHAFYQSFYDWPSLLKQSSLDESQVHLEMESLLSQVRPEDVATIIYTSGSTGEPKGVMLTHANLVSQLMATHKRFPMPVGQMRALSCLPLAHVFERMVMYFYLSAQVDVYFVDDMNQISAYAQEVRPHMMTMVPRILEKIERRLREVCADKTGLAKRLMSSALAWASDKEVKRPFLGLKGFVFERLVFGSIRKRLGGAFQYLIVGGAALDSSLACFFMNLGFPVYQGYGLTETSPVIAANYPGHNRPGYVGPLFPDVEVKIAADDEILVKGPGVMRGYYRNDEETRRVMDDQGWFHTGDLGSYEHGFLSVQGRKKELFKTSTGKYISPLPIEAALTQNSLIESAVVVADNRSYVTALLFIETQALRKFAKEKDLDYLDEATLLISEDLKHFLEGIIAQVNQDLNHWEQVRDFRLVAEPLAVELGTMTPTLKVRRAEVYLRYKNLIEDMYALSSVVERRA